MGTDVETWERADAGRLFELVTAALPGEGLAEDDLMACLFDDADPSVTLATREGTGVASVVIRGAGEHRAGFFQLIAVHPDHRRSGAGAMLVGAAEDWAREQGAERIAVGAAAPFYLWPGVDFGATPALCLFESLGYRQSGAELNMTCPTSFRVPAPPGIAVERVLEEGPARDVVAFCARGFPNWVPELERGIEHGAAFRAVDADVAETVGFACHSVNRLGWIGPMATEPARRHRGVGAALLAALCGDLYAAGRTHAEIAWVGPVGFYANTAGATVSRAFRRLAKPLL